MAIRKASKSEQRIYHSIGKAPSAGEFFVYIFRLAGMIAMVVGIVYVVR